MSVNNLLIALSKYFDLKLNQDSLPQEEWQTAMTSAKKYVAEQLNSYIDWRTDGVLEERKRRINTGEGIKIAEGLTSSFLALRALNSAPLPPEEGFSLKELQTWASSYKEWYATLRKEATG